MSDDFKHLALAAEFPATDREEWLRLVKAALKDRPFEKLVSTTYDAIAVQPLYARARGAPTVAGRPPGKPWQVLQRVDHPDPAAANAQARQDLENGATGLSLVFAHSAGAHGFGLPLTDSAIARALDGIHLDAGIALDLDMDAQDGGAAAALVPLLLRSGLDPRGCTIRFGFDPLGAMARHGGLPAPWGRVRERFATQIADLAAQGFAGPFAVADGRPVHAAGGSEAQELAFIIASAVAYLRALTDSGTAVGKARQMIHFRLAADADQFLTLAKFRALRKLWARIEQASGLSPEPAFVTAVTAWRMMTARDPYVNILRATLAVTAAGLGGADAVVVLPFTLALGLPDAFARRVARNLQLVLLEESNLYRVADPAAGSGALEALTQELAQKAWALFQEMESVGGLGAAITQGWVQKKVTEVRGARTAAVARRKDAITGVSDYPDLGERRIPVLEAPRASDLRLQRESACEPLPEIRLAAPFEALRDASDAMLAKTRSRPKVFLANLGRLSDFNARATFAKNLYEAGGIEAIANDGFLLPSPPSSSPAPSPTAPEPIGEVKTDIAAMVDAFKSSGAKLACICSSDKVYAAEAERAAAALKAAGAIVHLAGRPGEHERTWKQAGVTTYIYAGCDVLATLRAAYEVMDRP